MEQKDTKGMICVFLLGEWRFYTLSDIWCVVAGLHNSRTKWFERDTNQTKSLCNQVLKNRRIPELNL